MNNRCIQLLLEIVPCLSNQGSQEHLLSQRADLVSIEVPPERKKEIHHPFGAAPYSAAFAWNE